MGKKLVEKIKDNCAVLCLKSLEDFKNGLLKHSFMKSSTWVSGSGVMFTKQHGNVELIDLNLGL